MLILILIFYRCCKCKPIDRTELCAVIYIYILLVTAMMNLHVEVLVAIFCEPMIITNGSFRADLYICVSLVIFCGRCFTQ